MITLRGFHCSYALINSNELAYYRNPLTKHRMVKGELSVHDKSQIYRIPLPVKSLIVWSMQSFFTYLKNYLAFASLIFDYVCEWGWTARNLIARQSIVRHFWQEINCSSQNLSTARIQLIWLNRIWAVDTSF